MNFIFQLSVVAHFLHLCFYEGLLNIFTVSKKKKDTK